MAKHLKNILGAILGMALLLSGATIVLPIGQAKAATGFQGAYDPANWTLSNANGDGYVDTTGAPNSIRLVGSDNYSYSYGMVDYTVPVECSGQISFSWNYHTDDWSPAYDPAGYVVNGVYNQIVYDWGPNDQSGVATVSVNAGDTFGFRIITVDNILGRGAFTNISNFETPVCNTAPVAADQTIATNEDTPVSITLAATDAENDALTFSVLTPPSFGTLAGTAPNLTYSPNANFYGTDSFTFIASDSLLGSNTATVTITVNPVNDAPDVSSAAPSQARLWSPNHKMVPVTINGVTDIEGDTVTITITGIRQDEPTMSKENGDKSPDGTGVGTSTAELRAERFGKGDGRVYHIFFTASDGTDNTNGEVVVFVPHDDDVTKPVVDQGPIYDSTQP